MTIRLYDTQRRSKAIFEPIDANAVRLYVCGPTVWDYAHIGNARPIIIFDVLFRLLRHVYGADRVVYARNITDVDDKINARATRDFSELPMNEAIARVTSVTELQFHQDVRSLNCLDPSFEPHATGHIDEMRMLIDRLVERGFAYVAADHVLFSPSAMDAAAPPRYGALSRRSLDEMIAGARVDVAPYKRDPMDFVLWKPSRENEPGWPSPAGVNTLGRPGWHIECSAMSMAKLLSPYGGGLRCEDAEKNVFDIHGGGIDLVFPHHENEIAQSCCAFGSARMANFFMHNGFLQVEGEKMAKSAGNFITIDQLLRQPSFGGRAWPGEVLRFAMLRTHYRQPIDWTVRSLEEAEATLQKFALAAAAESAPTPSAEIVSAIADDLNTSEAIMHLHGLAKDAKDPNLGEAARAHAASQIRADLAFLGVELPGSRAEAALDIDLRRKIEILVERREEARKLKDWAGADRLRSELAALGVVVNDSKDGAIWRLAR